MSFYLIRLDYQDIIMDLHLEKVSLQYIRTVKSQISQRNSHSLTRAFAMHVVLYIEPNDSVGGQRRPRSACADAHSLFAYMPIRHLIP